MGYVKDNQRQTMPNQLVIKLNLFNYFGLKNYYQCFDNTDSDIDSGV